MPVSAETLRLLMAAGLTGEALLDVVSSIDADVTSTPKVRSSHAMRQERYRQRKASQTVTSDASRDVSDSDVIIEKESPQTPKEKQEPPKENTPLRGVQKKRGQRLPSDFTMPDDWRDWAIQRGLPAERVPVEFEKLTNWAANAPDSKAAKSDWFKAWKNWVIGAIDALPRSRAGPAKPMNPTLAAALRLKDQFDAVTPSEIEGHHPPPRLVAIGGRSG